MAVDWNKVDDAALALMHLTTFNDRGGPRSWKGYDWDILDRLYERGFISDPKRPARSFGLTDEAVKRSRQLFEESFGALSESASDRGPILPTKSAHAPADRCECGCGTAVRDRAFVPGHDQKLRIQLEQRVGGLLALRDLIERMEAYARGDDSLENLGTAVQQAMTAEDMA